MKYGIVSPATLTAILIAGSSAGSALAAGAGGNDEAAALRGARVTLVEAISTAERQTGGRAYDAGVDTRTSPVRIVVETSGPKGVQTVAVDSQSGQVVATHDGGEED